MHAAPSPTHLAFRHPLPIRIAHWINVTAMTILLLSGLQIFNAHPELDFGSTSSFYKHPALTIGATGEPPDRGYVQVFGHRLNTTGVLGVSRVDGDETERAFPSWLRCRRSRIWRPGGAGISCSPGSSSSTASSISPSGCSPASCAAA